MNILQAISDPAIFAPAFRDTRSWQAWFVFLAALFGLPLKPEQLAIYQQCTNRTEPRTKPSHEAWLVIGRRGGKSFVLALIAVFLSCFRDWRPYLNVGESGTIMIVAADRRQARTIMRYVKGLLSMVPMLSQLIESETRESITLTNRIVIEVHSSSFRAVRGYTVVACLADEIAFWVTDEGGANPDFEVLNAVRPAMSTIPDSLLLAASSPYARRGTLWETYHKHFGHDAPRLVWQAATRVMNPTVPQRLVDEALEADPSAAAAEYLAQFRTDVESFISREAVERCVNPGALEHPPLLNHQYLAFVDPSGGSNDAMTLAIAHKDADEVAVLDVIRERRPPFSPEAVTAEFAELLKSYRVTRLLGDRYAGEWAREPFRKQGISYDPAAAPKSELYGNLLPLVNSRRVRLLNNKRLIGQLLGLERRTSRAGRDSIDHAPGGHDDLCNAAAGVLVEVMKKKPQLRVGTIACGPGLSGKISWNDDESHRQRIRIVTVTEKDDLRQRGLL